MGQPYVGEIRMFGSDFAPVGWAICDGSLMSIVEYETLFQLIGTRYGGDGLATFALPDMRGRVPMHFGQGNGLSPRTLGEKGGIEAVTLTGTQIPDHTHFPLASKQPGNADTPGGHFFAASEKVSQFAPISSINTTLNENSIDIGANALPHNNMMPFQAVNYIISLFGIFPSET
ncbi:MAG TPA: tail fiber protein [Pyrinomonadaceae bacterium]|nr:tail fiber protein [Pyrinomonadaceae bacterium]